MPCLALFAFGLIQDNQDHAIGDSRFGMWVFLFRKCKRTATTFGGRAFMYKMHDGQSLKTADAEIRDPD